MQVKLGNNLVFCDSFMFITSSLESLVQSIRKTDKIQLKHLESLMSTRYSGTNIKLFLRKGAIPYKNLDSFVKFYDHELPLREKFICTLRYEECSAEDNDFSHGVWTTFGCVSLEDYLKLYLASDVCQLEDVFQNFRSICHQN